MGRANPGVAPMTSLSRMLLILSSAALLLPATGCQVANDWTAAMHAGCAECGLGHAFGHHTQVSYDVDDQPSPGKFYPVPTRPVFFPSASAVGPDLATPPIPKALPPAAARAN